MADRTGMGRRWLGRAVVVVALLALPASAAAAPRMYVSTTRAADGSVAVSGYAVDGTTQIMDAFQLDLVHGGVTVATDAATGFVALAPGTLAAGDALVLTDVTTAESHAATFTGNPTLVAPACGAAGFSGTRDEGATVDLSAALGADGVPTVERFGAGTTYAGAFAKALAAGWTVQASQARAISAGFTVFDAVSAVVGACPVVAKVTVPEAVAPAPAVDPAPVVEPAPPALPALAVADTVAPVGRAALRTKAGAAAYEALLAGTFSVSVTVDEPGTITQTLAAGRVVVGTAVKRVAKAGAVVLKVRLSASGRRRLTRSASTKLTLTTKLRDSAGNARTLPVSRFTAKRATR